MTRINIGIKPQQLTDEHLRAEYREIQRLPSYYRKAVASGSINRIPEKPTLGKGHVLWCLDKFHYTSRRYISIHAEMQKRFDVGEIDMSAIYLLVDDPNFPEKHLESYYPTPEDTEMLKARITERIQNSPKKYWHYRGERITAEQAIKLLEEYE